MSLYNIEVTKKNGESIALSHYQDKVLLIVNTASKCGFSKQFKELEELYQMFNHNEFEILGFPCNQFGGQEPNDGQGASEFCQLNYGVTFEIFEKVKVKGKEAHPLFKYLTDNTKGLLTDGIKWNFTKFLVNKEGKVVERYASSVNPLEIKERIEELIHE